jgi:hypothetical protein
MQRPAKATPSGLHFPNFIFVVRAAVCYIFQIKHKPIEDVKAFLDTLLTPSATKALMLKRVASKDDTVWQAIAREVFGHEHSDMHSVSKTDLTSASNFPDDDSASDVADDPFDGDTGDNTNSDDEIGRSSGEDIFIDADAPSTSRTRRATKHSAELEKMQCGFKRAKCVLADDDDNVQRLSQELKNMSSQEK